MNNVDNVFIVKNVVVCKTLQIVLSYSIAFCTNILHFKIIYFKTDEKFDNVITIFLHIHLLYDRFLLAQFSNGRLSV
jgi:hypothetical protein